MEWLLVPGALGVAIIVFLLGYNAGQSHHSTSEDVMYMLEHKFKDRWEAYKLGIREGYQAHVEDQKKEEDVA